MRWIAAAALLFLPIVAAAADFAPPAERRSVDLPPDRDGPVPVRVDFFLLDVTAINGSEESFRASLYLELSWRDARLAFDAAEFGADRVLYPGDAAEEQLAAMWSPAVDIDNLVDEPEIIDQLLTIHADGRVSYERRLTATFRSPMNLSRFPFDQQTLEVRLESFVWDASELQLVVAPEKAGRPHVNEELSIRGWDLVASGVRVQEHDYVTGDSYSRFVSTMTVTREPWFYMWSVVLPLVMITFFAITCFFWDQETLSERIAQVLTCLLTATAQSLAVADDLPRISYFTPIDYAFLLTYATLVAVAGISLWTKAIHGRNPLVADRIDLRAAAIVSAAYTLGMGLVFWL